MKRLALLILILFTLFACDNTTQVKMYDTNQDGDFPVSPGSGLLGNVDFRAIAETIQGSAIILINGPGASVGYDIRDKDDSAFIYFADSYIGAGDYAMQTGTQIPYNKWVHVRMVIYESGLSGYIVSFLQFLGLDFFEALEDYMIEAVYEADFMFVSKSSTIRTPRIENSRVTWAKLRQNTQNQTIKKAIVENRKIWEASDIDIEQFYKDLDSLKNNH